MSAPLAILLAAGKSTRMKSDTPKVLHDVCGRPMIDYVMTAVREAGVEKIVVVIGHQADRVRDALKDQPDVEFAVQSEQLGTGHAVMMCEEQLTGRDGSVLVLAGDTPLLRPDSLRSLLEEQRTHDAACVIGSAVTANNAGLGRVVRDDAGEFVAIVEHKDATEAQREIQEINTGCYAFDGPKLLSTLNRLRPENSQAEYYLTDCPAILLKDGDVVRASPSLDINEAMGVNTRVQLAAVSRVIQSEIQHRLMVSGVTIVAPETTHIERDVTIGPDTVLHPGTIIRSNATIGSHCIIGPHAVIEANAKITDGTTVPPLTVQG